MTEAKKNTPLPSNLGGSSYESTEGQSAYAPQFSLKPNSDKKAILDSHDKFKAIVNKTLVDKVLQDLSVNTSPVYKENYLKTLEDKGYDKDQLNKIASFAKPETAAQNLQRGASQGAGEPDMSKPEVPAVQEANEESLPDKAINAVGGYVEKQGEMIQSGLTQMKDAAKDALPSPTKRPDLDYRSTLDQIAAPALNFVAGGAKAAFGTAGLVVPQMVAFNAATEGVHALPETAKAAIASTIIPDSQNMTDKELSEKFDKTIDFPFAAASTIGNALFGESKEGSAGAATKEILDIVVGGWFLHKVSSGGEKPQIKDSESLLSTINKIKNGEATALELKDYQEFSNSLQGMTMEDIHDEAEKQGYTDIANKIKEANTVTDEDTHKKIVELNKKIENTPNDSPIKQGLIKTRQGLAKDMVDKSNLSVTKHVRDAHLNGTIADLDVKIEDAKKSMDGESDVVKQSIEETIKQLEGKKDELINLKPKEISDQVINNEETQKSEKDAIQEPSASSILQYPQEGVGETGSERGGVEQGVEGNQPTQESEKGSKEEAESVSQEAKSAVSGIKKKLVPENVEMPETWEKVSDDDMVSLGEKLYKSGEVDAKRIIEDVKAGTKSVLEPKEVPALIYHKAVLDKSLKEAYEEQAAALGSGKDTKSADDNIKRLNEEIYDYNMMSLVTAQQQSLAFRLRKGLRDSNTFDVVKEIYEYKSKNGGEISPETEKRFNDIAKELSELKKKISDMEAENEKKAEEQAIKDIKESVAREKKGPKKYSDKAKEVAKNIRKLKGKKFEIRDENGNVIDVTVQGFTWNDLIESIAKAVEKSGSVADAISESLSKLEWYKKLTEKGKAAVSSQLKEHFASNSEGVTEGKIKIPKSLIRELVEGGIDNINDLVKAVKEELKLDATDRDVRDAITNYGNTINKSGEQIDIDIRKMKRIGQLISKIEDAKNKKRPKRSGLQRDKIEVDERLMQKELNDLLKDLPQEDVDLEKYQKNLLDTTKSRLKNHIEELDKAIKENKKIERNPNKVEYDQEAKDLVVERDELKKKYDSIFGKTELTYEQKIQRAIATTEAAIVKAKERVKNKELESNKTKLAETPELKSAKDRLKSLNETLKEMREQAGINDKRKLESAKIRAKKVIEKRQAQLKSGDFTKKEKRAIEDNELIKLRAQSEKLLDEVREAQYRNELANRTFPEVLKADTFKVIGGLLRMATAGVDLGASVVQGGRRLFTHPMEALTAFKKSLQALGSTDKSKEFLNEIKAQEWYPLMKEAKVALLEESYRTKVQEEQPAGNIVGMLWNLPAKGVEMIFGENKASTTWRNMNIYNAFQRAYDAHVNYIRVQSFLKIAANVEKDGVDLKKDKESLKAIGEYVNTQTGRSKLPGGLESSSELSAGLFFSARKQVATIKYLNPVYYARLPKYVRKQAIIESVTSLAAITTVAMLAEFGAGDDDDWDEFFDSNSAAFLSVKVKGDKGDFTLIDLTSGMRSYVNVLSRFASGKFRDSSTGVTSYLGERYMKDINTRKDLLGSYVANKLSPAAALALKVMDQSKGREIDWEEMPNELFLPMWTNDLGEVYEDHPEVIASLLTSLNIIGAGVQHYRLTHKQKRDRGNKLSISNKNTREHLKE